jgi:hypothetical protein
MFIVRVACRAVPRAYSFGFFLMSLLAKLSLLSINSMQSYCSLQYSLSVFFLIALACQCVYLDPNKMMSYQ